MNHAFAIRLLAVALLLASGNPQAQSTSFTYQGQLRQSGQPFTGMADLEFRLYDQLTAGNPIGNAQSLPNWPVEDGLFQVELDFGASAFNGSDRFLEVTVDGAPLIPRQKITATPVALLATGLASGSVGAGSVDPTEIQLRITGTCPAGEYVQEVNQDGSVVCGTDGDSGGTVTQIDTGAGLSGGPITETGTLSIAAGGVGAAQIDPTEVQQRIAGTCHAGTSIRIVNQDGSVVCEADDTGPGAWRLDGNAGTNPSTNFLGTTDAAPFEIRTADVRSLRIEPSVETFQGSPITTNTIAGSSANEVSIGVRGATISGGGVPSGNSDPDLPFEDPNRVVDDYGTVGGGYGNTAGNDTGTSNFGAWATVGGGRGNSATLNGSTVGGGIDNRASGGGSVVGGGRQNKASGPSSTVSGGTVNEATGETSTIGGGLFNIAHGTGITISGGTENRALGDFSTVSGGSENCAGGEHSWAGGLKAKVRPSPGETVFCTGEDSGDADGDEGTFIWADSRNVPFISTGPDQFLVRARGGVGLGTNAPVTQLHVVKSINEPATTGNHVALIENDSGNTGSGPDVLALKSSALTPNAATNYITFYNGNDQAVGAIEGDGSGGISFTSGGADFAEWLPKRDPDEDIHPGDVVGWHADGISHITEGALRVMAVSTRPIVAGNSPREGEEDDWAQVGFVGQVPVRVRGPVAAGDWIVASGANDGSAVAAAPGRITPESLSSVIGQALTSKKDHRALLVNVAVGLGSHHAVAPSLARLQHENKALRGRLARLESDQASELVALRQELALLHDFLTTESGPQHAAHLASHDTTRNQGAPE